MLIYLKNGNNYSGFQMFTVADPGFPRGGAPTPQGAPTYNFAKISQKLHEIERIGPPGGREGRAPPLRSATGSLELLLKSASFYTS